MSKRSKFVMCTWVGPNVSVMKKAKMSTDKALMKDIIQVGVIMQHYVLDFIINYYLQHRIFLLNFNVRMPMS